MQHLQSAERERHPDRIRAVCVRWRNEVLATTEVAFKTGPKWGVHSVVCGRDHYQTQRDQRD